MPKYVIIHGSLKKDGKTLGPGSTVELEADEAKHVDPTGERLATPERYAKLQEMAKLEKQLAEGEKPKQQAKE